MLGIVISIILIGTILYLTEFEIEKNNYCNNYINMDKYTYDKSIQVLTCYNETHNYTTKFIKKKGWY